MKRICILLITVTLLFGMVGCGDGGGVEYDLAISSSAGGTVTTPGEGTFTCDAGEVVNLAAEVEGGYHFVHWTGDVSTVADIYLPVTNITMYGDYEIRAEFASGTYSVQTISTTSWGMFTIHSGDIDGDGLFEASILHNGGGFWFVDYEDGDYVVSNVTDPGGVFGDVADTDGDGRAEVIAANGNGIQIVSYVAPGVFQIDADLPVEGGARGVIAGEVGSNESMRIIAGSENSGYVHVFKYQEDNYVEEWSGIVVPDSEIIPTAAGDVDNDGQTEFLINVWETPGYGPSNGNIYVYKWTGVTYEPILIQHTDAEDYMSAAISDLDRDGKNELIIDTTDEITVYKYSSQSGKLEHVWSAPSGEWASQIAIGDVDGDGQDEAIWFPHYSVYPTYHGRIIVIGYDGIGYSVEAAIHGFSGELGGGTVADFDDDGYNEIITSLFNIEAPEYPIYLVKYTPLEE